MELEDEFNELHESPEFELDEADAWEVEPSANFDSDDESEGEEDPEEDAVMGGGSGGAGAAGYHHDIIC